MLEFNSVYGGYGREDVLKGASLVCKNGEITVIIGENGCGKSTLLKSAVGLSSISSGSVLVNGKSILSFSEAERAKRIAYLSQGKNIPDITVERMVLHGRFPYLSYPRRYRREDLAIAAEAMEKMGISSLAAKELRELSGGMRQKVYIAMALCQQADIILLDEPTTYLDIGQQFRLCDSLKALAGDGKTVVAVLHDILLALKVADTIAVMESGSMAAIGSPGEILASKVIEKVFGVSVKTAITEDGEEYYYEKRGYEG